MANKTPHRVTKGIASIVTRDKKKLKHLYHYMYKDSTFFLKRKHDKFAKMLS